MDFPYANAVAKNVMSTFALTAAIAMPAVALAAAAPTRSASGPNVAATVSQMQPAAEMRDMAASNVTLRSKQKADQSSRMQQTASDRQTVRRLQDQTRQLGATQ